MLRSQNTLRCVSGMSTDLTVDDVGRRITPGKLRALILQMMDSCQKHHGGIRRS